MRKKSALALATAGLYVSLLGMDYNSPDESYKISDEEKKRRIQDRENKKIEALKSKGVKEFFYGDVVIYARNQKNADRKARNKGILNKES